MSKKLTKAQLVSHLKHMEKDELIKEISTLYSKFKEVKAYYQLEYGSKEDREALLKEYKKKIDDQFYTRMGNPKFPSAATLRKIISNFKKISPVSFDIANLLYHRVYMGIEFTNDFGDMDEAYYNSIESAWRELLILINKEKLHQYFEKRCRELIDSTYDIGWGLFDRLEYEYKAIFGS